MDIGTTIPRRAGTSIHNAIIGWIKKSAARDIKMFCPAAAETAITVQDRAEQSFAGEDYYRMLWEYGSGSVRIMNFYDQFLTALDFLVQNPNSPELNFAFQQIKDCPAAGRTRQLYMEDKHSLNKAVTQMKNDLSAYPSIAELAQTANMSTSRFQLAFRQVYGTTAYEYLKVMRMNYALLLLQDSDEKIRNIALKAGYRNAGHFAGLFREMRASRHH